MTMKMAVPILLAAVGFAAAGCGGSARTSSGGGTGSVAGTVATVSTTTAAASGSFDVQFGNVRQRLQRGLRGIENGSLTSAATLLTTCQSSTTTQLGARATTTGQEQAVSYLRTACDDVAKAEAKLRGGDTSAARQLAKDALQQVTQAARAAR
jgi:type 1 fimbria pilin